MTRPKRSTWRPINYYLDGRYRVCATSTGRVLLVALKFPHKERVLEYGSRTFREIVRKVEAQEGIKLSKASPYRRFK